jgi:hypothetical protein
VFGDPRSQAVLDEVGEARLRAQGGGMVLSPDRLR